MFTGAVAAVEQRFGMAQLEDGGRVAYALTGHGPILLVAPGWLSHLELGWSIPSERLFHEALSSGRTLVRRARASSRHPKREQAPALQSPVRS